MEKMIENTKNYKKLNKNVFYYIAFDVTIVYIGRDVNIGWV